MSKKTIMPAVGAAIAGSLLLAGAANAAENPFGLKELNAGYVQLADAHGKDGEGKCAGSMKDKEGKCGDSMKDKEGKCGDSMKEKEGKCGSGKCGGQK